MRRRLRRLLVAVICPRLRALKQAQKKGPGWGPLCRPSVGLVDVTANGVRRLRMPPAHLCQACGPEHVVEIRTRRARVSYCLVSSPIAALINQVSRMPQLALCLRVTHDAPMTARPAALVARRAPGPWSITKVDRRGASAAPSHLCWHPMHDT